MGVRDLNSGVHTYIEISDQDISAPDVILYSIIYILIAIHYYEKSILLVPGSLGVGEVFGFCSSDKIKGEENSSTERREKQRKAESAGPVGRIQHRREKGMSLETQAVRNGEREDGDQEERRW